MHRGRGGAGGGGRGEARGEGGVGGGGRASWAGGPVRPYRQPGPRGVGEVSAIMDREMMGGSRQGGGEREPLRREEEAPVGGRRPWDRAGAPPRGGNAAPSGRRVGRIVSWSADDDRESGLRRGATGGQPGGDRRGLGPRRAPRSDERIREEGCDRLMDDRHVDATDVEVRVEGGEGTLTGTVDRRGTRRRAEDLAEAGRGGAHGPN